MKESQEIYDYQQALHIARTGDAIALCAALQVDTLTNEQRDYIFTVFGTPYTYE